MTASKNSQRRNKNPAFHLLAGGAAGLVESTCCHPLDTIKTRIQLQQGRHGNATAACADAIRLHSSTNSSASKKCSTSAAAAAASNASTCSSSKAAIPLHEVGMVNIRRLFSSLAPPQQSSISFGSLGDAAAAEAAAASNPTQPLGTVGTARSIVSREGFPALYKGLTAVWSGIVPKMAIRFLSFEWYRDHLGLLQTRFSATDTSAKLQQSPPSGQYTRSVTFAAGLLAGLTEAILIVTPAEVCKIRMQSQVNSTVDKAQLHRRKYTNVVQTASVIVREEGIGALYSGVVPTMMRQGCNQAVNFTTYNCVKDSIIQHRKERGESQVGLRPYESLVLGGISGGLGPLLNNPLDVVKTRMQKQTLREGVKPKYSGLFQSCVLIAKEEGVEALWKGITPRLMRIMPGQAITFMTYEFVSRQLDDRL